MVHTTKIGVLMNSVGSGTESVCSQTADVATLEDPQRVERIEMERIREIVASSEETGPLPLSETRADVTLCPLGDRVEIRHLDFPDLSPSPAPRAGRLVGYMGDNDVLNLRGDDVVSIHRRSKDIRCPIRGVVSEITGGLTGVVRIASAPVELHTTGGRAYRFEHLDSAIRRDGTTGELIRSEAYIIAAYGLEKHGLDRGSSTQLPADQNFPPPRGLTISIGEHERSLIMVFARRPDGELRLHLVVIRPHFIKEAGPGSAAIYIREINQTVRMRYETLKADPVASC